MIDDGWWMMDDGDNEEWAYMLLWQNKCKKLMTLKIIEKLFKFFSRIFRHTWYTLYLQGENPLSGLLHNFIIRPKWFRKDLEKKKKLVRNSGKKRIEFEFETQWLRSLYQSRKIIKIVAPRKLRFFIPDFLSHLQLALISRRGME